MTTTTTRHRALIAALAVVGVSALGAGTASAATVSANIAYTTHASDLACDDPTTPAGTPTCHIAVLNTDGVGREVTSGAQNNDVDPSWSPDGTRLAFARNSGAGYDIFVMKADGSNLVKLTSDPRDDRYPTWSPDGTKLAYRGYGSGTGTRIFLVAPGGGRRRPSRGRTAATSRPSTPTARRIAFTASTTAASLGPGGRRIEHLAQQQPPDQQPERAVQSDFNTNWSAQYMQPLLRNSRSTRRGSSWWSRNSTGHLGDPAAVDDHQHALERPQRVLGLRVRGAVSRRRQTVGGPGRSAGARQPDARGSRHDGADRRRAGAVAGGHRSGRIWPTRGTQRTAELALKRLIVGGTAGCELERRIDPSDRPDFAPQPIDIAAAVRRALDSRTDLAGREKNLRSTTSR